MGRSKTQSFIKILRYVLPFRRGRKSLFKFINHILIFNQWTSDSGLTIWREIRYYFKG